LPIIRPITEHLDLIEVQGVAWLACSRCGKPLSSGSDNYKLRCHRLDLPIQIANSLIGEPQRFIEEEVRFRQFCCPACGGLIENEVCREKDPVLWDIELDPYGSHPNFRP
jgi:N-methylhydantoinase B